MENNSKFKIGAAVLSLVLTGAVIGGVAAQNNVIYGQIPFVAYAQYNILNCGKYSTNIEDNISYDEIANLPNYNASNMLATSNLLDSVGYEGYCVHDNTYHSLRIGSGSRGSITFTLKKDINAIGFYACAYQNDKDTGKSLLVNDIELDKKLPAAQFYDNSDTLRFFYELPEPINEITIKAKEVKNNRFHLYSVGFYTLTF